MPRKMLVNAAEAGESRVAILSDGVLDELNIEFHAQRKIKGNIYAATVVRIEPSIQAAFLEYGAERHGFLSVSEVNFNLFKPKGGRRRIEDLIKRNDRIMVQAIREERGQKGAALSTFVSLPGRYLVYMPDCAGGGISRKIEDAAERKQLKAFFESVEAEAGGEAPGLIIRTAGVGRSIEELQRDYHYLRELWTRIKEVYEKRGDSPGLVYQEHDIITRTIRDYFSSDIEEIMVDNEEVAERVRDFLRRTMPEYVDRVTLHQEKRPIFSRYQTEDQIATIYKRQVPLPSGGSIVIDPTEALVAIDVNSGRANQSRSPEETSFRTNMEAAVEIARQLRLRDLGGLIVCDFIDMDEAKHRHKVEAALAQAMKGDKARFDVGKISKFGLLELSRQRVKASLLEGSHQTCPQCQGTGRVASSESVATGLLRALQATAANADVQRIELTVAPEIAGYLLNDGRDTLIALERLRDVAIYVASDPTLLPHESRQEVIKRRPEEPVEAAEVATPLDVEAPELVREPTSAAAPAEEGAKSRRRRRRRRGRGRGAAETATANGAAVAGEPSATESLADAAEPAAAVAEAAETQVETVPSEEPAAAPKKKRSRRGRRRKGAAAKAETETPAGAPETVAEAAPVPEETPAPPEPATPAVDVGAAPPSPPAEPIPPAKKPAPPRRRKKAAAPPVASPPEQPSPAVAEPAATDTAAEAVALAPEAAPEAPVKKKRAPAKKRAVAKKKAPAKKRATTPAPADEAPPEAPAKKKRAPAKRKAPAKKRAATSPKPAASPTDDTQAANQ